MSPYNTTCVVRIQNETMKYISGKWVPLAHFPSLMEGRHYHGVSTFGLVPHVFGGWNNGSLATVEQLDQCKLPPGYTKIQ